jgi:peptide deformylase
MAVRCILTYPDPILKQVSATVESVDESVAAILDDLIVVVVDVSKSKLGKDNNHGLLEMVNPNIIERSGSRVMREGCMSVPDYTGNVTRAEHIVVEFIDRSGQLQVIEASGFEAVAIQHEIDHLDGLLFLDRVSSLKTDLYRRKQ